MNTVSPFRRFRFAGVTATVVLSLAGLAGASLLAGCGGSGSTAANSVVSAATGRATVTITWPMRSTSSRLIPIDSNSIIVSFSQNGTLITQQVITRPTTGSTSTATFPSLPTGVLTAQAAAYPNSDGTGVPQAVASVSATIVSGQNTAVGITMNSTINHITITPTSATITVGAMTTLSETPYDAAGNVVLTSASTISWSSSNTAVATVSSTGVVTGVLAGSATITVTESESGVTATIPVTVNAPVSVSITPTAPTIAILASQTFAATVTGSTNQNVTWSVLEGSTGGTITSAGVYTAPATAGTYHVVATSVADPTKSATATVTVQSGSSTVTIN